MPVINNTYIYNIADSEEVENEYSSIENWWDRAVFAWFNDDMSNCTIRIQFRAFNYMFDHMPHEDLSEARKALLTNLWGRIVNQSENGGTPNVSIFLVQN